MEGSCILTYKAVNLMKGRCYKSVNSKGETVSVIIIEHADADKNYVVATGTYANRETNTLVVGTGKMNIAMRAADRPRPELKEPDEYSKYILYDNVSEISMSDAKEFISRVITPYGTASV